MTTSPVQPASAGEPAVRDFLGRALHHLRYSVGRRKSEASREEVFRAIAFAVREDLIDRMIETEERYQRHDAKRLYYLSIEYLIGRSLRDTLTNLRLYEVCSAACRELGVELQELLEVEPDAALGNGGLGRLAACFLESLATLGMPGFGYGINYEFGLFRQEIQNGAQREKPDHWLSLGAPWMIERRDRAYRIPVYGHLDQGDPTLGGQHGIWLDWRLLVGIPHDLPVAGFGGRTGNFLRLFSARSSDEFDIAIFTQGDYIKAVEQKISSENISKVLYPSDSVASGRELRLLQEYFLIACAMRDIVRRYRAHHKTFDEFPNRVAIQLNDTHPALAIAELMRILVDHHDVTWDQAWIITTATFAYTNHTLLPEALEKWPVKLLEAVLPRHLQIIYEINQRFLEVVKARFPGDLDRMRRMSLIEEGQEKRVRMAYLSIVGSHSVNGVAALHSELIRKNLVPDFAELWPEKFNSKTNGVTHRRWLLQSNPELAALLTGAVGENWFLDLNALRAIEPFAEDSAFRDEFLRVKRLNKEKLAKVVWDSTRLAVSPDTLFDIHAKRIHEYKRQLLNVMHIVHLYLSLVEDGKQLTAPRTFLFAGKAAPGYFKAKLIIRLVNSVAAVINQDPRTKEQLRVVFVPDYRVSLAERIMPAADLSEQISTAGMEASGTGNMKFAMNGALTIGTMDGANIEICEEVGRENMFIFGLTADQIEDLRRRNAYSPTEIYNSRPAVRRVMDALAGNRFCPHEPGLFHPLTDGVLKHGDYYFHLADLESYIAAQEAAAQLYLDRAQWARKALLNVARMGKFSSDRTIAEYARDIWNIKPILD
jgi:starch phosphorylase